MIAKTMLAAIPLALVMTAGTARSEPEQPKAPDPSASPAVQPGNTALPSPASAPTSPAAPSAAAQPDNPAPADAGQKTGTSDLPPARGSAQVVYLASSQRPGFAMLSPGNAVFGALGGIAAISTSKKLAEDNDFTEPAAEMRVDVAKAFAASKGLTLADSPIMLPPGDPKASFATAMQTAKSMGAQYVVDLGTLVWLVSYFPLDWTHYGTTYGAAIRIIDVQSGAVLTKGRCSVKPEHTADSPDKEQLLADKAARLKSMAAGAAAKCGAILKADVLKLPAASPASSD